MTKLGSVQRAFVPVHALEENALVLAFSHAPTARDLIGILEVSGLNYPLKSEAEQQRINDLFQVVLASLTYSLQVLMRVMPFDLEGYLAACGLGNGEQEPEKAWAGSLHLICSLPPRPSTYSDVDASTLLRYRSGRANRP